MAKNLQNVKCAIRIIDGLMICEIIAVQYTPFLIEVDSSIIRQSPATPRRLLVGKVMANETTQGNIFFLAFNLIKGNVIDEQMIHFRSLQTNS
jgi:hypothetical protein